MNLRLWYVSSTPSGSYVLFFHFVYKHSTPSASEELCGSDVGSTPLTNCGSASFAKHALPWLPAEAEIKFACRNPGEGVAHPEEMEC
jgi:hypothetical protein